LNKSGKRGNPCLIPDLRGNNFSFSTFSIVMAIDLLHIAFIMLRNVLCFLRFFQSSYHERMWNLVNDFVSIYGNDDMVFVFDSAYVLYYVYWFEYVVPSLYPWDDTYLITICDLFNVLLDFVVKYFIEDFCIYIHQGHWPTIFLFFLFDASLPVFGIKVILICRMSLVTFLLFVFHGIIWSIGVSFSLKFW
jgi:hypothetical protein